MTKVLYIIDLVLLLLIGVAAAGCGSRDGRLDRADRLACEDPQGALELLDSIDAASLSRGDRARFGLLRCKARDKNHEPGRRDSLLDFAAEYYAGRGDSLEVQALYYQGVGLSDEESAARAIPTLEEAYRKALANDDHFYAGMAARELGYVFEAQHIVDRQLVWNEKAREEFLKAGKKIHAAWMDLDIADALIYAGRTKEAERILSDLDTEEYANSPHFRKRALRNRLALYSHAGRHDEVIATADSLVGEGMELRPYDYYMLADSYLKKGELSRANEFRDSLAKNMEQRSDTLCLYYLDSKIARSGKISPERVEAMWMMIEKIMTIDEKNLTHPETLLLADNYSLEATLNRERAESTKQRAKLMLIVFTLLVIVGVTVLLYLRGRFRIRRLEEARLRDQLKDRSLQIASLQVDLALLDRQIDEAKQQLDARERSILEKEDLIERINREKAGAHHEHEMIEKSFMEREKEFQTEIERLTESRDAMSREREELMKECKNMAKLKAIVNEINSQGSSGIRKSGLAKIIRHNCESAIMLYALWRKCDAVDDRSATAIAVRERVECLKNPAYWEKCAEALDSTNDNWLSKTISKAGLKGQEKELMTYLYLGLSAELIAFIMDKKRIENVNVAKSRLRKTLLRVLTEQKEEFNRYLGMKL